MSVITTEAGETLWWSAEGEDQPGHEPLLLIQGLGYTADMWHRTAAPLARNRRVVRFDNRGVGRSTVPPTPWSMEDLAEDALAVLDAAKVYRAHVFGFSMGGVIAQELALRHPRRAASLILGGTHPGGRAAVRMDAAAATMLMDRSPRSPREVAEDSVPFLYADTTSRDDIDADLTVRLRHLLRATAYWGQLDAMRKHEGTIDRLPAIRVPTLVVHGTLDRLVQPGNASLLAATIPGARLHWMDGAGHLFWTDRPDETVKVIDEFLDEVESHADVHQPRID